MKTYAFRLKPNQDLLEGLSSFARQANVRAGLMLTCVGSLRCVCLRLANQPTVSLFEGPFEIVSLVGTFSPDGDHLHISIAASDGRMLGGHLMAGSLIFTTAEIVLGELEDVRFSRPLDAETSYDELVVTPAVGA